MISRVAAPSLLLTAVKEASNCLHPGQHLLLAFLIITIPGGYDVASHGSLD